MQALSAAAPEGIGQHIRFSFAMEQGEPRAVWNLDDKGAAFINEFADSIGIPANLILRELSLHAGTLLIRGDLQMGDDNG